MAGLAFYVFFFVQSSCELEEDIMAVDNPGFLVHGAAGARRAVQEVVLPWQT